MYAGLTGCGGGASGATATTVPGTTPGNYLVQIVGASASLTETCNVTLTIQ
jgi:hypothetical protein